MKFYHINVNMKQFKQNWKHYSDNVRWAENIERSKGKLFVNNERDYKTYIRWLNEFNIFYTASQIGK